MNTNKVVIILISIVLMTVVVKWQSIFTPSISELGDLKIDETQKESRLFPLDDELPVSNIVEQSSNKPSGAQHFLPKKAKSISLSEQDIEAIKLQSLAKQNEINDLIVLHNENINNPTKRKKLKIQMAKLIDEYNQLTLPLALKAMSEQNHG